MLKKHKKQLVTIYHMLKMKGLSVILCF